MAIADGLLVIDPLTEDSLQPASYDLSVGREAFVSSSESTIDVENRGLVVIDAGEFAVISTLERVHCKPQIAGQLGLSSQFARHGLVLLSGPQIDPGFNGVLVVRLTNLSPKRITLPFEAPFLTAQFFKLNHPVSKPYAGSRQGQTGLQPRDIEELNNPDSPTLGGMVKTLTALASDVGDLKTAVKWMAWAIPIIVTIGMAVVAITASLN